MFHIIVHADTLSSYTLDFFQQDLPEPQPYLINQFFPEQKVAVDQACSRGTIQADGMLRCREVCKESLFEECCELPESYESSACNVQGNS